MSGPLLPEDTAPSAYPVEPKIPFQIIEAVAKKSRSMTDMKFDDSGMFMMSIAVEEFMKNLLLDATDGGKEELTYDNMAEVIDKSKDEKLKMFFPKRMTMADVREQIRQAQEAEQRKAEAARYKQHGIGEGTSSSSEGLPAKLTQLALVKTQPPQSTPFPAKAREPALWTLPTPSPAFFPELARTKYPVPASERKMATALDNPIPARTKYPLPASARNPAETGTPAAAPARFGTGTLGTVPARTMAGNPAAAPARHLIGNFGTAPPRAMVGAPAAAPRKLMMGAPAATPARTQMGISGGSSETPARYSAPIAAPIAAPMTASASTPATAPATIQASSSAPSQQAEHNN